MRWGSLHPEVEYKLAVSDHDRQKVDDLLRRYGLVNPGRFVVVNPVAKWESKLWSNGKFAQLADRIIAQYDAASFLPAALKIVRRYVKSRRA